jgi:hypothetical protein
MPSQARLAVRFSGLQGNYLIWKIVEWKPPPPPPPQKLKSLQLALWATCSSEPSLASVLQIVWNWRSRHLLAVAEVTFAKNAAFWTFYPIVPRRKN